MAVVGCQATASTEGAGFTQTHPQIGTVKYLFQNDRQFLNETTVNNRTCARAPACKKDKPK